MFNGKCVKIDCNVMFNGRWKDGVERQKENGIETFCIPT